MSICRNLGEYMEFRVWLLGRYNIKVLYDRDMVVAIVKEQLNHQLREFNKTHVEALKKISSPKDENQNRNFELMLTKYLDEKLRFTSKRHGTNFSHTEGGITVSLELE